MSHHGEHVQKALRNPALSPDNEFLAVITPHQVLHIYDLKIGRLITELAFPQDAHSFLPEVQITDWAPESIVVENDQSEAERDVIQTWILLAGGSRLITIEVKLSIKGIFTSTDAVIVADFQFESRYGKLLLAEFVFNHDQALVAFEMNVHASLISFAKPHRQDISDPKFPDHQGFVQSCQRRYFALILRSKGQDQVAVFSPSQSDLLTPSVFIPGTIDAQGIKWSPNNDPVLAIWESTTYGPEIRFFTALGHPLKQLNLSPVNFRAGLLPTPPSGLGVAHVNWTLLADKSTFLAIGIGGSQLAVRKQIHASLNLSPIALYYHLPVVDGSMCIVWQQDKDDCFEKQTTVFEIKIELTSEVSLIEINNDASLIATCVTSTPTVVWIWNRASHSSSEIESPASVLIFQHGVKKIVWHPLLPNVFAVVTSERKPSIYVSHNLYEYPQKVSLSFEEPMLSSRWNLQWIVLPQTTRCPMLVSSNKYFDIGFVSRSDSCIKFRSLLTTQDLEPAPDDNASLIDTPSKPGKTVAPTTGWHLDVANAEWDATASVDAW